MKVIKALGFGMLGAALLLVAVAPASAQCSPPGCQLNGCTGTPSCRPSCAPLAINHANTDPCGSGGAFNLRGSQYQNVCGASGAGGCQQPPLRFWQYSNFGGANNGCADPAQPGNEWMSNAFVDFGVGTEAGHWILFGSQWSAPGVDNCINSSGNPTRRTVAEISFPDGPSETTINHQSWYMIASVAEGAGGYNFDSVTGASGCNGSDVVAVPVPSPTATGGTPALTACTGTTTPSVFPANGDANYFDVSFTIGNGGNARGYSDAGGPANLVAGFQVVYRGGAEPTSSAAAGWLPARDTTSPATLAAAVIPTGNAGPHTVSLPMAGGPFWIGLRLVYDDASVNPLTTFDPTTSCGPLLTSDVSAHCGPVAGGASPVAVEFAEVSAERTPQGVTVRWMTLSEDDTLGFKVMRATDAQGSDAEAASKLVQAAGPYQPYSFTDESVAPSDVASTWYYVQEITEHGLGDRSAAVQAGPSARAVGSAGRGRSRVSNRDR